MRDRVSLQGMTYDEACACFEEACPNPNPNPMAIMSLRPFFNISCCSL
jgi:hypothetical protein